MPRYDVYGFRQASLEEAVSFVERVLGIPFTRRDSSYRGIYYRAGSGIDRNYVLQTNDEEARWHRDYPEYGVTLMVNDQPDMDGIREKLTSDPDDPHRPVFLHSIIHTKEPPEEYPAEPE